MVQVKPNSTIVSEPALRPPVLTFLAESGEEGVDGQLPSAVDRGPGGAEPARGLLHGQTLGQGEQAVGDVGLVAVDDPRIDAAPDPVHDELPGGRPGLQFGRAWIEVGERPGEHDLCQHRAIRYEDPEHLDRAQQVGARVSRLPQRCETGAEEPEALEENLADQAGLVAEELVDGGWRRLGLFGDLPGGETTNPVRGQQRDRHLHDVVAQLPGSLLGSWHCPTWPVSLRAGRQGAPGTRRRRRRLLPAAPAAPAAARAAWWPRARPGRGWPAWPRLPRRPWPARRAVPPGQG